MKKIVLFGDSIMAGYHDGMVSNEFTDRIRNAFPNDKVINVSVPGYRTSDAVSVAKKVSALDPDLCILAIGANDISIHDEIKPGKFAANLTYILEEIGCDKSILVSPPLTDWRRNPDRPWTRQLQFELVTEHLGKQLDVKYLDLLHQMSSVSSVDELLQVDGLHFSKKGYDLLEETLVPMMNRFLNNHGSLVSN